MMSSGAVDLPVPLLLQHSVNAFNEKRLPGEI